jgi:membrane protease YdiL (CAAX protease family)
MNSPGIVVREAAMDDSPPIKPLGWAPSLGIFLATAASIWATHYRFAPWFKAATGQPYLVGYLVGWIGNMGLFFGLSLLAYRREGRPLAWRAFSLRYRLDRMPKRDWLLALALIVVAAACSLGLSFTARWLSSIPFFAPHPAFPRDFVTGQVIPGTLFEMGLRGRWWLIPTYFIGWLLNIAGEEFWYRGWMLPRQEAAFGKSAWIVNALMFTFQHFLFPWNFLTILPGALFVVWVVQRRRNTWLSIIQHGFMNLAPFVYIVLGVMGIP